MACSVVNDTLVKHVSEGLPSGQLIVLRGLFATAPWGTLVDKRPANGAWSFFG